MSDAAKHSPRFRQLRHAWPLMREQWREGGVGLALSLVGIGAGLLQPWPMKFIVDNVLGFTPGAGHTIHDGNLPGLLLMACLVMLGLHFLRLSLSAWSTVRLVRAGLLMAHALRCRVYEHLQRLSLVYHENRPVGDSIRRVAWDTMSIQTLFNGGLVPLVNAAVMFLGIMVIMLRFDWLLTLLALAIAPALAVSIRFFNRRIKEVSTEYHDREGKVSSVIQESLSAIRTIQAFAREEEEVARFHARAEKSVSANIRMTRTQVFSSFVVGMITAVGTVAVIWVAGHRVLDQRLTIGELLVAVSYVGMLYGPMNTISGLANTVQGALTPFCRVTEIIETTPAIADRPGARRCGPCTGHCRFDQVTFGYDPRKPVVQEVTFDLAPGQMIALVGPSGAGKTTLLSLLLRFYDPQAGRILVDDTDIREFQYLSLRQQISIVPQEPVLFSASVAENIAYGRPHAARSEIEQAARDAAADEFVRNMPQGYDTVLGERGATLSGGQRQRLALARAFLKQSTILILDEPTAAMDAESEAAILSALQHLRRDRAILVVAHRLSTVRHADQLLVLTDGRITARGTHAELVQADGPYARWARLQFGADNMEAAR